MENKFDSDLKRGKNRVKMNIFIDISLQYHDKLFQDELYEIEERRQRSIEEFGIYWSFHYNWCIRWLLEEQTMAREPLKPIIESKRLENERCRQYRQWPSSELQAATIRNLLYDFFEILKMCLYQNEKIRAMLNRSLTIPLFDAFTDPGLEMLQKWLASKWFVSDL